MIKNAPGSNAAPAPSPDAARLTYRVFRFFDDRPVRVKLIVAFLIVTALSVGHASAANR